MANIGTFTTDKDGFTGTLRTLTLNVKVKLAPNDKGNSENAPDFRLQAAGHDIGAAWNKTSEAGREYKSVLCGEPHNTENVALEFMWSSNRAAFRRGRSSPMSAT